MPGNEGEGWPSREAESFSRLDPGDKEFIKKLDNRLKLSEWIDDPKKEQLGRGIVVFYPVSGKEKDEYAPRIIGRIFPLEEDNSSHLVVFSNRRMVKVEPLPSRNEKERKQNLHDHQSIFGFKTVDLDYELSDPNQDFDTQISRVVNSLSEDGLVTHSNDPQDDLPSFDVAVEAEKALSIARKLKEKREQRLDTDVASIIALYKREDNPPNGSANPDPSA